MKVAISVRRTVVIDYNIDTLHVNAPTKDVGRNKDALLECFESSIPGNPGIRMSLTESNEKTPAYRSSCCRPEWMLMLGKLQDTKSLSNSIARATDLTNMTT